MLSQGSGWRGPTARPQRILDEALRHTGAQVIATCSFWLSRSNNETRMSEPNRDVALELGRRFGIESADTVLTITMHEPSWWRIETRATTFSRRC